METDAGSVGCACRRGQTSIIVNRVIAGLIACKWAGRIGGKCVGSISQGKLNGDPVVCVGGDGLGWDGQGNGAIPRCRDSPLRLRQQVARHPIVVRVETDPHCLLDAIGGKVQTKVYRPPIRSTPNRLIPCHLSARAGRICEISQVIIVDPTIAGQRSRRRCRCRSRGDCR